jgi:hypothetical protein
MPFERPQTYRLLEFDVVSQGAEAVEAAINELAPRYEVVSGPVVAGSGRIVLFLLKYR